jgi:hypothetical protein
MIAIRFQYYTVDARDSSAASEGLYENSQIGETSVDATARTLKGSIVGLALTASEIEKVDALEDFTLSFSHIMKYNLAGKYEDKTDMPKTNENSYEGSNAFNITTFIDNPKKSAARITENYLLVHEIETIKTPVIEFFAKVEEDSVVIYAANNGWGNSSKYTVDVEFEAVTPGDLNVNNILTRTNEVPTFSIESGKIVEMIRYNINTIELSAMENEGTELYIKIWAKPTINGIPVGRKDLGRLSRDGFSLKWNELTSSGGDDGDIKFAVLTNVDELKAGSKISFPGQRPEVTASGSSKIETVIVPDKSCRMVFQLVYVVNKKTLKTQEFTANITVPYYLEPREEILYSNEKFIDDMVRDGKIVKGQIVIAVPDPPPTPNTVTNNGGIVDPPTNASAIKTIELTIGSSYMYVNKIRKAIDLNDENVVAIIDNNRTLVPIRAIAEELGAEVDWESAAKKVTIKRNDTTIILRINDNNIYVGVRRIELDVVPKLINNRTMVPLRVVAEELNCKVDWEQKTKTVTIVSEQDGVV